MDQSTEDAITKIENQFLERDERISRIEDRITALEKCLADFVGAFQIAIAAASK